MSASAEEMKYHIMSVQSCFLIYIFCAMSSTAKRLYKESQRMMQLFSMQIAWSCDSWVERTLTFWVKRFAKFANSFEIFKNWSTIVFSIYVNQRFSSVTEKFKESYKASRSNRMCIMMLCCLRFWVDWVLEASHFFCWLHWQENLRVTFLAKLNWWILHVSRF